MSEMFDAIVIGSGITGGWAAKELTERGLKTLMIERGRDVPHQSGYTTETAAPWDLPFRGFGDAKLFQRDYSVQSLGRGFDEWTQQFYVNDRENPYQTTQTEPFQWRRGYQLGGKSLLWGRQCYRWSDLDFGANASDGHGTDWPIRYADIERWYDYVEDFIGVSGSAEGLPQLPDGKFQPPMALNVMERELKRRVEHAYPDRRVMIGRTANLTQEKRDRSPCQYRGICPRGCSYGAYFSTQSSTLPAAMATGRLTVLPDTLVEEIDYDPQTRRAAGVRTRNTRTGASTFYQARVIFLCASTINSIAVLLRSRSASFPNGLANSSGVVGQYLMDHAQTVAVVASIKGFEDRTYFGNRPTGIAIPRFRNLDNTSSDILRGYSFQGVSARHNWSRGEAKAGLGEALKNDLHGPGDWWMALGVFAECLPRAENRVTLDENHLDPMGLPQIRIEFSYGPNEAKLLADAKQQALAMIGLMESTVALSSDEAGYGGTSVHEMGGARMGRDPKTSVVNGHSQTHDIANLFITDGSAMASTACQNPSLTYMALTARACDTAVSMMKEHRI